MFHTSACLPLHVHVHGKQTAVKVILLNLSNESFNEVFLKCLFLDCREYVREVKVRLVKYLTSCPLSPNHAKEFFTMLLDEYQALSKAFDILRPFFSKLVRQFFLYIHVLEVLYIEPPERTGVPQNCEIICLQLSQSTTATLGKN